MDKDDGVNAAVSYSLLSGNTGSAFTVDTNRCVWRKRDTVGRFLNAVYFRRSLTCTLGLTNDLIDDGQLRAKPHLRKAKRNHVLKTVFVPRLATVYQVVG